ncbi:hypothetical protein ACFSQZ_10880, partial [Rubritalea spongiae]
MNKPLLLSVIGICVNQAHAATFVMPASNYDDLNGVATDTFVVAISDIGVNANISFTFTATAPGSTTITPVFNEDTRMGITSDFDQGAAAETSFNEGEVLTLTVSAVITSVPVGQTVSRPCGQIDYLIQSIMDARHMKDT